MRPVSFFAKRRRLLAVGLLSLLLHYIALEWIAGRYGAPRHALEAPASITLQLGARAPQSSAAPAAPPAAPLEPAHVAAPAPEPAKTKAIAPPLPAAALAPGLANTLDSAVPGVAPAAEQAVEMPGRYRVTPPPSAQLAFRVTRSEPGRAAVAQGVARLSWQLADGRYVLRIDSAGRSLDSRGTVGDDGIEPLSASETSGDGEASTRFDRAAGVIVIGSSGSSQPIGVGSQDRASMLMQLAGMGLARPAQISGNIDFHVGGSHDAGIVRFAVVGQEDIDSALGRISTWRLVQATPPGAARLELWLAPEHHWFPVQMRSTAPDGTVTTQVVARIALARPASR
jgi:hypothetical protein